MNNEENIAVIKTTDLPTLLQNLDDHAILTIILEGDNENAKE